MLHAPAMLIRTVRVQMSDTLDTQIIDALEKEHANDVTKTSASFASFHRCPIAWQCALRSPQDSGEPVHSRRKHRPRNQSQSSTVGCSTHRKSARGGLVTAPRAHTSCVSCVSCVFFDRDALVGQALNMLKKPSPRPSSESSASSQDLGC